MNILFLTLAEMDLNNVGNVYVDLVKELKNRGNEVYVVSANERRNKEDTNLILNDGITCLKIKTGNIQKTNIIEKGLSTLFIGYQFKRNIKKYLNVKFDLVLYSTPPITFVEVIRYVKKRDNAKTYLLLKDIFPQNAVDINMINKSGIIYRYFRLIEKRLYSISDYIGCMSLKNKQFIIKNNKYLDSKRIEICPNSIYINKNKLQIDKYKLRQEMGIRKDCFIMLYGGNLGRPQGIDFLVNLLNFYKDKKNIKTLVIGSGTEYIKLKGFIEKNNIKNVYIHKLVPKKVYEQYLKVADVGLILLDRRFTIPNFPSRLLAYMEYGLPVIAATDKNTDVREYVRAGGFGEWCESGDIKTFDKIINKMIYDKQLLNVMGKNSRKILERNFDVNISANKILNHFNN